MFYSSIEVVSMCLRISVAVSGENGVDLAAEFGTSDMAACQALLKNSSAGARPDVSTTDTLYTIIWFLAIWSMVVHVPNISYRLRRVFSLRYLYSHGYRRHWKYKHVMNLENLLPPDGASNFSEMKRD